MPEWVELSLLRNLTPYVAFLSLPSVVLQLDTDLYKQKYCFIAVLLSVKKMVL